MVLQKQQLETSAGYSREVSWIGMEQLTAEDVTNVMKKAANWKGPGPDKLHNNCLKKSRCMNQLLAELINEVIEEPQRLLSFLAH